MAGELYITPLELVNYYDRRRVLQLASDSDTVPATIEDLDDDDSDPYIKINTLIRGVCSDIDSKCQQGKRYDRTALEAMVAAAEESEDEAILKRAALLKQMTADLVYGRLNASRGIGAAELSILCPRYDEAEAMLEQLYQGARIFDLDLPKTAGVPSRVTINLNNINSFVSENAMFFVWGDQACR